MNIVWFFFNQTEIIGFVWFFCPLGFGGPALKLLQLRTFRYAQSKDTLFTHRSCTLIFHQRPKTRCLRVPRRWKVGRRHVLGMCTELHVVNYCVITVSPIMHARIIVKQ